MFVLGMPKISNNLEETYQPSSAIYETRAEQICVRMRSFAWLIPTIVALHTVTT